MNPTENNTSVLEDYDASKEYKYKRMLIKFRSLKNSYDRGHSEDAYWNCQDALYLAEQSRNGVILKRAIRLFDRNYDQV